MEEIHSGAGHWEEMERAVTYAASPHCSHIFDFWHLCYGYLAAVKYSYLLTSITWPYRGLRITTHRGRLFLFNRPFHTSLLGDLAFEWQRSWRWLCFPNCYRPPCFCHLNVPRYNFRTTWFTQQKGEFFIKTRSPPSSQPFKRHVTEQITVKWFNTRLQWMSLC